MYYHFELRKENEAEEQNNVHESEVFLFELNICSGPVPRYLVHDYFTAQLKMQKITRRIVRNRLQNDLKCRSVDAERKMLSK